MPQDRIITSSVNISAINSASGQTFNSPIFAGVVTFNNTPSMPGATFSNTPNLPGFHITSDTPNARADVGLGTSDSPVFDGLSLGTQDKSGTLNIKGDVYVNNNSARNELGNILFSGKVHNADSTVNLGGSDDTKALNINNSGTNAIRVDRTNSRVGIAISTSSAPTEALDVGGNIKASKLNLQSIPTCTDETDANSAGLLTGDVYKTPAGVLGIKL